jgi:hypothetical protein
MTQSIRDDTLIAMLEVLTGTGSTLYFCTAEPASYAGLAAVALAQVSAGTWSITTDAEGGKATCAEKTGITATASGNVVSIVIADDGANKILCTTDAMIFAANTGGDFTCPSFDIRLGNLT